MKQKEIELATVYMQMFLAGLALNFGANFHELEVHKTCALPGRKPVGSVVG
jgi:hypothetical protein